MKQSYEFLLKSRVEDIDFINKIMEAYEGIGVVRTLNPREGLLSVVLTEDFKDFVREVLEDLSKKWVQLEIISEGPWRGIL